MLEIEKKFLLKDIPDLSNYPFNDIEQGYLSFNPEIRIRKKGEKFFITQKSDGTQIRTEIETEINEVTYEILSTLLLGRLIKKTRFNIPLQEEIIAELDIYHDELEGLITVETEFTSEEQANGFLPPEWFGEDITKDKRYKNKNLARLENVEILLPKTEKSYRKTLTITK